MKVYIARDIKGMLWLHRTKPFWTDNKFWFSAYQPAELYADDYPEVTFENSPMEVELKLIEK